MSKVVRNGTKVLFEHPTKEIGWISGEVSCHFPKDDDKNELQYEIVLDNRQNERVIASSNELHAMIAAHQFKAVPVAKDFGEELGGIFKGRVIGAFWAQGGNDKEDEILFPIAYEDGDQEDFNEEELHEAIELYHEIQQQTAIPSPKRSKSKGRILSARKRKVAGPKTNGLDVMQEEDDEKDESEERQKRSRSRRKTKSPSIVEEPQNSISSPPSSHAQTTYDCQPLTQESKMDSQESSPETQPKGKKQKSGPEEQPKELFDISYSVNDILGEGPLEMKKDGFFQNRKPGTFDLNRLEGMSGWGYYDYDKREEEGDKTLRVLLDLFSHFHEKGIVWEKLEFVIDPFTERYTTPFFHAVNTMKIFRSIRVRIYWNKYAWDDEDYEELESLGDYDEDEELNVIDLCPGISSNNFTEELEILCYGSVLYEHSLALNNLLQTNAPCLQKLKFVEAMDYENILPGLRNNKTLKELKFDFWNCPVKDEVLSEIIAAVATNPNIESLYMHFGERDVVGDLSSKAFERLLSESTSLKELTLKSNFKKPGLNAGCLIRGMKNSRLLKLLLLGKLLCGDLIFASFFRILPDYPSLECIHVIVSDKDLAQVKLLPRLPRPIQLDAGTCEYERNAWDQLQKVFAELLRHHPELRLSLKKRDFISSDNADEWTDFWHIRNLNWHGRYLLDRSNVPLSIWPLVLEKVNDDKYLEDKASILYELLKGPACGVKRLTSW